LVKRVGTTTLTLTLEFLSKEAREIALKYGAVAGAAAALDTSASSWAAERSNAGDRTQAKDV
jgi:hypothetical protein